MTAEDFEAAFHGIELPSEIELAPGAVIRDVPLFLEKEITILKTSNYPRVTDPVVYRLNLVLELIKAQAL
ncbi:DUF6965 family protein [Pedobacter foliorum]|uniref:DUF6965 family protein n=1 Tax=Pedobacter foliorum TaxID=2739058 RepID=UPI0015632753|nr:hypothetical protein [Pedobacter foliorum]NRF40640.1 hypothetical protein [Pedobacter foliorum]